jgi:cytochrome c oxidase subunit III
MTTSVLLKAASSDGGDAGISGYAGGYRDSGNGRPSSVVGLWVFMGVATMLFVLFIAAYMMRMDASDWSAIGMPWQLWLSTALLVAGSVTLQAAGVSARAADAQRARTLLLAGGACALAFVGVQLWAWQALLSNRVMPAGNPAASFFYLLTAMHGLHVLGGLAGWGITLRRFQRSAALAGTVPTAQAIALCARYWHFLLALWIVLFATFDGITPAMINFICGTR